MTSLVPFDKVVNRKGDKKQLLLNWPSGFSQLPGPGGWEHQSYLHFRVLGALLRGERKGLNSLLSRA